VAGPAKKVEIPEKLYFRIGEVAKLVGVKPYVLRYWESEIPALRPTKTKSRHRLYRRRDVELLLEIKRLLYAERYTIEGAKKRLRELQRNGQKPQPDLPASPPSKPLSMKAARALIGKIRKDLTDIIKLLEQPSGELDVDGMPAARR